MLRILISFFTTCFCVGLNISPASAEQARYVFDESCVTVKTNRCLSETVKLYSSVAIAPLSSDSKTQLCMPSPGFSTDLNPISEIEAPIRAFIAQRVLSEARATDRFCPVLAEETTGLFGGTAYGCGDLLRTATICKLGDASKPLSHRYARGISEICETAVRQIPFSDDEQSTSCLRRLEIPDANLEGDFIEAMRGFGDVVTGLGKRIEERTAPNSLRCPVGDLVRIAYSSTRQEPGLENFRKWFSTQDHKEFATLVYKDEGVVFRKNDKDGEHVTVQVFRDEDRELGLDWHRFLQSALATEVRYFLVKDLANSNFEEPKKAKEVEIVVPASVDIASRPYLVSCLGNGANVEAAESGN